MTLSLSILTNTHSIIEASFTDEGVMKSMITYNNRRVRLSPWKMEVIERAIREKHDVESCIADAIAEKQHAY